MALPSDWSTFLAAIRAQESGNYSEDVAGCLGAYCWSSQSIWDGMASAAGEKQYVGVNPSQVPASVQDKVASANLYKAYQSAGGGTNGLAAAARWWNGGTTKSVPNPGLPAQPWAKQCGGGSSQAYACQILARMGLGGHYLAGSGSGAGGIVTTAAGATSDCAWSIGGQHIGLIFGHGPSVPSYCIFSKSQARAILAVAYIAAGGVLVLNGLILTLFATTVGKRVMQMAIGAPARGAAARAPAAAKAPAAAAGASPRAQHESGYGTIPASEAARQARAQQRAEAKAAEAPAGRHRKPERQPAKRPARRPAA
jgi:hypothetical protein